MKHVEVLIPLVAMATLLLAPQPANAGPGICPNCWTDILHSGCFKCVINPAPAFCSCSTVGSCPQVVTECGACSGTAPCGGSFCNHVCPGCCANPGGGNCCEGPNAKAVSSEIKPKIGDWVKNSDIAEAAEAKSPLMMKVLTHLQQLPTEDLMCDNLTGRVYNQDTKEISKFSIDINSDGVTTIRIYTRSTDQEDTLSVHPNGMWLLTRAANTLAPTPGTVTRLASGEATKTEKP